MTEKQQELHGDAMSRAGILADIARRRPLTPTERNRLMAALQSARMACNAAGLVDKETEGSPKIDELADILDEVCLQSGLKLVVFSQWKMMTEMVEQRLRRMDIGYVNLHGGIPTAKRGALMDSFQNDDSVQVFLSTDAGGVGLNLQSGSVLVNLDVPWNPAILEQRNGRIHRLGQTRTVQIITMVASDSYEDHVLGLVRNKQDLFDNVIAEDGELDVVGVSKKLLETLVEDLRPPADDLQDEKTKQDGEIIGSRAESQGDGKPAAAGNVDSSTDALEQELTDCIKGLQQAFGSRIERIIGTGGGLLAVLDQVGSEENQIAAKISDRIAVAVIDQSTLSGLERIGGMAPVTEGKIYYDAAEESRDQTVPRLFIIAAEKLKAAAVLMEQHIFSTAAELLTTALLAAAAGKAGMDAPVSARDAGVWIYGEALGRGILNEEEAGLIMRAVSLSQAESVPANLLQDLSRDVELFIENIA